MSVYTLDHYKDGAKIMRPVLNRDEYLALRSSEKQLAVLKAVRSGDEAKKRRLVQMNYSCIPADDGRLKGSTRMSTTVGMDIDHVPPEEMCPLGERILAKKDELGLKMLEKSARECGYHLVFSRRPELSQEANLEWASQLLNVAHDEGAKDITRVFYTTSAEPEDLLFLDDAIFACEEAFPSSWETARPEGALATEGTQDRHGVEEKSTVPSNDIRGIHESNQTTSGDDGYLHIEGCQFAEDVESSGVALHRRTEGQNHLFYFARLYPMHQRTNLQITGADAVHR